MIDLYIRGHEYKYMQRSKQLEDFLLYNDFHIYFLCFVYIFVPDNYLWDDCYVA